MNNLDDLQQLDYQERQALAEDCAQEALLAVFLHFHEFRGESKFTTWAYKFGVNTALSRARKERWKRVSLDTLQEDQDTLDWLDDPLLERSTLDESTALQNEVCLVIRETVRSELTSRQRQVLKWMVFDGVPMDVVVERFGTNRNAINKMLHDARLKVKRSLARHGYQVEEVYELSGKV